MDTVSYIFESLAHPHGWWIVPDLFLIGLGGTLCLIAIGGGE